MTKKIDEREIIVKFCSFETQLLDNTFEESFITTEDTISSKAFGLRLNLRYADELEICKTNPIETFSPFPSCYAVGPRRKIINYIPYNLTDSLEIISDKNFDSSHPAGTNLTNYFYIYKSNQNKYLESQDYLTNNRRLSFNNENDFVKRETIDLLLMHQPSNSDNHTFTIRFYTNQGEIIEQTTSSIHLKL